MCYGYAEAELLHWHMLEQELTILVVQRKIAYAITESELIL